MSLSRDVFYEIARNIKAWRDFAVFTACSRGTRSLIYNRAITSQFSWRAVIWNFGSDDKLEDIANFAEKTGFYIVANKSCMLDRINSSRIFTEYSVNLPATVSSLVMCNNCFVLYKYTNNDVFAKLCLIHEHSYYPPRCCRICGRIVCRANLGYDYAHKFSTAECLSCAPPYAICTSCGIFPITARFTNGNITKFICVKCQRYANDEIPCWLHRYNLLLNEHAKQ